MHIQAAIFQHFWHKNALKSIKMQHLKHVFRKSESHIYDYRT